MRRLLDSAMEGLPPFAYTRLGFNARRRLWCWDEPKPDSMDGKVVVVTGATRGLGHAAAEALSSAGATVETVGRSGGTRQGDIGDLDQVRALAKELASAHKRIDVLIHNAGAIPPTRTITPQGLEAIWAMMVVGPHLLTKLLRDQLAGGRVIWMTSGGMYTQRLHLDDVGMAHEEYDGVRQYARAKRAQVDLVHEYAQRGLPFTSLAAHPGWAATQGVEESLPTFNKVMGPVLRSADQGSDTVVWLAATDEPLRDGGLYFDRRLRSDRRLPNTSTSAADRARLWALVESQVTDDDAGQ